MDLSTNHRGLRHGLTVMVVLLGLLAGLLAGAASGAFAQSTSGVTPPPAEVFALTTSDQLLLFNGADPNTILDTINITGLASGESLIGVDFRPNGGELYGVGDQNNIYTINEDTGEADQVSTLSIPLEGNRFGVDFNPVPDRLRIVSNTDQNLRVNVDTGVVATDVTANGDLDLQYAMADENEGENPKVTGVAYTNNTQPSPRDPNVLGTTLYDIDFGLDILTTQNPPNNGTLNTVGDLGIDTRSLVGFDIETTSSGSEPTTSSISVEPINRAFAALLRAGKDASTFHSIDLDTGASNNMGRINGGNTKVEDIAIPIPSPT